MNKDFKKYIQCQCGQCAVGFEGFEIEYYRETEEDPYAFVEASLWSMGYGDNRDGIWKRIKNAWNYLRGKRVYTDYLHFEKEGVQKLHDITKEILEIWPSDDKLKELQEKRLKHIQNIKKEIQKDI